MCSSADLLFDSVTVSYQDRAIAVVLTEYDRERIGMILVMEAAP
ncbi:MAG: hypothetical protein AAFN18_21430 [Cyanobacteria bacterium J06554_6]